MLNGDFWDSVPFRLGSMTNILIVICVRQMAKNGRKQQCTDCAAPFSGRSVASKACHSRLKTGSRLVMNAASASLWSALVESWDNSFALARAASCGERSGACETARLVASTERGARLAMRSAKLTAAAIKVSGACTAVTRPNCSAVDASCGNEFQPCCGPNAFRACFAQGVIHNYCTTDFGSTTPYCHAGLQF